MKQLKKIMIPTFTLILLLTFQAPVLATIDSLPAQSEQTLGKRKKYKGYKKPKSKKFLGIFKRKSDCGCPNK
ncbi:hypothetical protein [Dyadobacter tibetensis]|uniref:hypothetical protein n=1 Tax=Dyadobacter tibetensis TaxID=1211851 RepID=UPI000471DA3C|nr:hypothetical protein [Dyadobacter tibetensis]